MQLKLLLLYSWASLAGADESMYTPAGPSAESLREWGFAGLNFSAVAAEWWPKLRNLFPLESVGQFELGLRSLLKHGSSLHKANAQAREQNGTNRPFSYYWQTIYVPLVKKCYADCTDEKLTGTLECIEHLKKYITMDEWSLVHRECTTTRQQREPGTVLLRQCYGTRQGWPCKPVEEGLFMWGRPELHKRIWFHVRDNLSFTRSATQRKPVQLVLGLCLLSAFTLIGIIGNIVVISVAATSIEFRSVTSIYLANLAVADLLFLSINIYIELVPRILLAYGEERFFGVDTHQFFCGFPPQIRSMCYICSVFTLIAIGFERFIVITMPMKAKSWCTRGKAKRIVPASWVISLFLSQTEHFRWGVTYATALKPLCSDEDSIPFWHWLLKLMSDSVPDREEIKGKIVLAEFVVLFAVPMIILAILYGSVAVALLRSIKTAKSMTGEEKQNGEKGVASMSGESLRERMMLVRLMIVVLIAFTVFQAPLRIVYYMVTAVWDGVHGTISYELRQEVFGITKVMSAIGPALNPLLYTFTSRQFRRATTLMFAKMLHIKLEQQGEEFKSRTVYSTYQKPSPSRAAGQ